MKNRYFVEMTDTYGGEANYCWVNRFIVSALTPRGAMRRVCNRTGDKVQCVMSGDPERWDIRTDCVCYFVEWIDDEQVKELQDKYSRIEVIE